MKIKFFLLLSSLILQSQLKAVSLGDSKLPTQEEVLQTGNPLTITLYANREKYKKNPIVPKTDTLCECLQKHSLLSSPWIHEKYFSKDIASAYNDGASEKGIEDVIKKNESYKAIPEITQKYLMANLMQAFLDCRKATRSHR